MAGAGEGSDRRHEAGCGQNVRGLRRDRRSLVAVEGQELQGAEDDTHAEHRLEEGAHRELVGEAVEAFQNHEVQEAEDRTTPCEGSQRQLGTEAEGLDDEESCAGSEHRAEKGKKCAHS